MWGKKVFSALGVAAAVLVAGCSYKVDINGQVANPDLTPTPEYEGVRPTIGTDWYEVSQGWNAALRRAYWFTPQGSTLVPYDWFLALEMPERNCSGKPDEGLNPGGWTLFRDSEHLSSLGYIPAPKDPLWNPDGLPVGFAKTPTEDGDFMGPTCAACHSNMMHLKKAGANYGYDVLVEGAPTLSDLQSLNEGLANALCSMLPSRIDKALGTYPGDKEAEKKAAQAQFDRFAERVLGPNVDQKAKDQLLADVVEFTPSVRIRNELNYNPLEHPYGKGRLDALGAILNEVTVNKAQVLGNRYPANAPVSYPFLWGTPQADVVQWNGSVDNSNIGRNPLKFGTGALGRNVGEVVGVYGHVVLNPSEAGQAFKAKQSEAKRRFLAPNLIRGRESAQFGGFESSVMMANLGSIEHWISRLKSPQWPTSVLGDINLDMATRGEDIYRGNAVEGVKCVGCHEIIPRAQEWKPYNSVMIPVDEIGTDKTVSANFLMKKNPRNGEPWRTGAFEGLKTSVVFGDPIGETFALRAEALFVTVKGVILGDAITAGVTGAWRSRSDAPPHEQDLSDAALDRYKARPLNGIWATAPYLHNGSVPSLDALLTAEADRPAKFCVGSRVFDPAVVGFESATVGTGDATGCPQDKYNQTLLDTSGLGNANTGHSSLRQGIGLTAADKKALIEFLKTL